MPLTACFPPSPGVRPWKPALCVEGVSACGLAPRRARGPRVRRPPWTPRCGTALVRRPRSDAGAPQNRRGAGGRRGVGCSAAACTRTAGPERDTEVRRARTRGTHVAGRGGRGKGRAGAGPRGRARVQTRRGAVALARRRRDAASPRPRAQRWLRPPAGASAVGEGAQGGRVPGATLRLVGPAGP